MMAKRLCALFAVLAISLGVAYGCAKKIELVGFDVIAEDAVSYGADYTVPVYNVRDNDGKIYSVNYTVTNGGNPVEVVGGKFTDNRLPDYLYRCGQRKAQRYENNGRQSERYGPPVCFPRRNGKILYRRGKDKTARCGGAG